VTLAEVEVEVPGLAAVLAVLVVTQVAALVVETPVDPGALPGIVPLGRVDSSAGTPLSA